MCHLTLRQELVCSLVPLRSQELLRSPEQVCSREPLRSPELLLGKVVYRPMRKLLRCVVPDLTVTDPQYFHESEHGRSKMLLVDCKWA